MDKDTKTNAVLAWIFAPIPGFLWRNHQNDFLQAHSRESFYFGIFNLGLYLLAFIITIPIWIIIGVAPFLGIILSCLSWILWILILLVTTAPRIIGAIKAWNGEKWEVPYVSKYLRKYIKL